MASLMNRIPVGVATTISEALSRYEDSMGSLFAAVPAAYILDVLDQHTAKLKVRLLCSAATLSSSDHPISF